MAVFPLVGLEYSAEDEAEGEVAAIYEDVRRTLQAPFVPNGVKALSASPVILSGYWALYKTVLSRTSLPLPLISMIHFSIAASNDCTYCASWNELTCRNSGIDDDTLNAMIRDLPHLSPERVRTIIQFSLTLVHSPQALGMEDFDELRNAGVSDEEIMEIMMIAAIGQMHDCFADALKIEVDAPVVSALADARAH